jgi:hypothetical protein
VPTGGGATDDKAIYEQAAQLNRYFFNWRQAMLAGYFALLYGVVSLALNACGNAPNWVGPILGVASAFGLAFIVAELRIRECYHRAAGVAKLIALGGKADHGPKDLYAQMETAPRRWPLRA